MSDIHGNLEALEAVLQDARKERVKRFFCAGDIVGYGANPRECIKIMQEIGARCVMGNHDYTAISSQEPFSFSDAAKEALDFTRKQLGSDDREFLRGLPFLLEEGDIVVAHGSIVKPEQFNYIIYNPRSSSSSLMNATFIGENFRMLAEGKRLFLGHAHVPFRLGFRDNQAMFQPDSINEISSSEGYDKVMCNAGSVGQPRDRDRRACYMIYNPTSGEIEIRRADYDIDKAAGKIRSAGLPAKLAARLYTGE